MVFGYPGREDYRDVAGHTWRPGTELVTRVANGADTVAACWWTQAAPGEITGTHDPELYRYGVHGRDFWVSLTVGPGLYHARLKFAATRGLDTRTNCFDIRINGRLVVERLDVAATAGGTNRAVDLVFNNIAPDKRRRGNPVHRCAAFEHQHNCARRGVRAGAGDRPRQRSGQGARPVSVAGGRWHRV